MNLLLKISLVVALAAVVLFPFYPEYAPYVMAAGALGIAISHFAERYDGSNLRLKRIVRLRHYVALLYLIAAFCMFRPRTYHGAWLVVLLLAAVLEIYTLWVKSSAESKGVEDAAAKPRRRQ
jgi:hypothetical protein